MNHEIDQKKNPWLTIIVPVYNAEKHLDRCISSIQKQSFNEYELIVVDDGSTDRSAEICARYTWADQRVKYLPKQNGGPFQARVFGVEYARGQYLTFCDADDYYASKDAFQRMYEVLHENRYDAMQFAHRIQYNHLSRKSSLVKEPLQIDREAFIQDEYPLFLCSSAEGAHLTMNVWNKVYKRSLLSNLPSSETTPRLFWGEDLVLNLYALRRIEAFTIIPDILYVYRDFTGGTAKYSRNEMKDLNTIKEHQLSFLSEMDLSNKAALLERLHCETACWFAVWVKEGVQSLKEEEIATVVEEALSLPQIQEAREYFLNECNLKWEQIELLRKGSVQGYIEWAKKHPTPKKGFKETLKRIYKTI